MGEQRSHLNGEQTKAIYSANAWKKNSDTLSMRLVNRGNRDDTTPVRNICVIIDAALARTIVCSLTQLPCDRYVPLSRNSGAIHFDFLTKRHFTPFVCRLILTSPGSDASQKHEPLTQSQLAHGKNCRNCSVA